MTTFKTLTGQGEPVVILHGWACNHWYMQPIVQQLSSRYSVINVDLPGRGRTDWRADIRTIHDIADLVIADLPQTAIYVGWSFGSLVSFSIAARYPKRVSQIVGICSTPKFIADENWLGVPKPGFKSAVAKELQNISFNDFLKAYFDKAGKF